MRRWPAEDHPVDEAAEVDAREAVGKQHDDGDEEGADDEEPELGERLGKVRLAEVDDERAVDGAEEGATAAYGRCDDHLDRGHDADEGGRHEADLEGEHRAADAGVDGRQDEDERLDAGHVVASEEDALFAVPEGHEEPTELAPDEREAERDGAKEEDRVDVVEDQPRRVGPDVPAVERLEVGDAVDAARIAPAYR